MISQKPELKSKSRPAVPKFDESWSPEPQTDKSFADDPGLSKGIKKKKHALKNRKTEPNFDDLNLDLIGQLFEENITKVQDDQVAKTTQKKVKISYAEEYDPSKPNDYLQLDLQRKRNNEIKQMMLLENKAKSLREAITAPLQPSVNEMFINPPPLSSFPPLPPGPIPNMPDFSHKFPSQLDPGTRLGTNPPLPAMPPPLPPRSYDFHSPAPTDYQT